MCFSGLLLCGVGCLGCLGAVLLGWYFGLIAFFGFGGYAGVAWRICFSDLCSGFLVVDLLVVVGCCGWW